MDKFDNIIENIKTDLKTLNVTASDYSYGISRIIEELYEIRRVYVAELSKETTKDFTTERY